MKILCCLVVVLWCIAGVASRKVSKNTMKSYCYYFRQSGDMMYRPNDIIRDDLCPDTFRPQCTVEPLGMENGQIPDSSITASSVHSEIFHHYDRKVWRAADNHGPNQWLKVDIGKVQRIYVMDTHGYSHGNHMEWVDKFVMQYSRDGKRFFNYRGGMVLKSGYFNRIHLRPPLIARYVKIIPKTWHNRVAFWMELYRLKRGNFSPLLAYLWDKNYEVSSFYGAIWPAKEARLNNRFKNIMEPGAWRGLTLHSQWIQVDLGKVTTVTAIATQGAPDGTNVNYYVTLFSMQYSNDGKIFNKLYDFNFTLPKILKFRANKDRNTIVRNNFPYPIHARYIRVIPRLWLRGMTMRFELYGCRSAPRRPSNYRPPNKTKMCQDFKSYYVYIC